MTTLEEIERHWNICDLYDAHEALDVQEEFREWEEKKMDAKMK